MRQSIQVHRGRRQGFLPTGKESVKLTLKAQIERLKFYSSNSSSTHSNHFGLIRDVTFLGEMASFIKSVDTGFIVALLLLMLNFIGKSAPRQNSCLSATRQVNTDILPRERLFQCFLVIDE